MNKLVIPSILTATLLIASIFAFMPVYKASTVHTTILANTAKEVSVTSTVKTTTGPNTFTITCASTSNACQIQEIYLIVTVTGTASVTPAVTFTVAGATAASTVAGATLTAIASGSTVPIPAVGGLAIGPSDTVTVITTGSAATTGQSLRIVALVSGAAPALTVA